MQGLDGKLFAQEVLPKIRLTQNARLQATPKARSSGTGRAMRVGQDRRPFSVEGDVGPAFPPVRWGDPDNDRPHDIAFFDTTARSGVLHRSDDYVTYAAVSAP